MNWKFWKRPKAAVELQIVVVHRDPCKLRLHEWRSDQNLTSAAAKVLLDPNVRIMMDVLNNEHPAFNVLHHASPEHMRAAHQARSEGYTLALSNIEAMARHQPLNVELEATFEREEKPNE